MLLAITVVVAALTILPGRVKIQASGAHLVHLVLFASFLFLAFIP